MKDQHYSMKDPSDWTNEDMEMYKRDESRIEYTEEQIKNAQGKSSLLDLPSLNFLVML